MENCYLIINKTEGVQGGVIGVFKTRALANEQVKAIKELCLNGSWSGTEPKLVIKKRILFE